MGVVSRKPVWVESMGVASWCGCKEVYKLFIPTPLVSALVRQRVTKLQADLCGKWCHLFKLTACLYWYNFHLD